MRIAKPSPAFLSVFIFIISAGVLAGRNNDAIKAALAKPDRTVKASWFGWEAAEATAALQEAIFSGAKKVVIDNVGEWIVDRIFLTNDQELVFEKGVVLSAKKGAFKGKTDAILNGVGVRNLVITGNGALVRMWKADYFGPDYAKAEWRHALNLKSASNVKVTDLILKDSGGDGVYLGNAGGANLPYCADIVLRNVTCDGHARQGISVISAVNLLIEDCILINTSGTAPEAGIDWEPNGSNEGIVNNVMRRTRIVGNKGSGIDIYLKQLRATTRDLSLRIEDCIVSNNRTGLALTYNGGGHPGGSIELARCAFQESRTVAARIFNKALGRGTLRFDRCVFAGSTNTFGVPAPLVLGSEGEMTVSQGDVEFTGCSVTSPVELPAFVLQNGAETAVSRVTGRLAVTVSGRKAELDLAERVQELTKDLVVTADIRPYAMQGVTLAPRGGTPPEKRPPLTLREDGDVLVAAAGGKLRFTLAVKKLGAGYGVTAVPVVVRSPSGKKVEAPALALGEEKVYELDAPEAGVYRVTWDPKNNLSSISSPEPYCHRAEGRNVHLFACAATFYLHAPAGVSRFFVRAGGQPPGEGVKVKVLDEKGTVLAEGDDVASAKRFVVNRDPAAASVYTVLLSKPTGVAFEDVFVTAVGVPPLFAPTKEDLLVPVKKE